MIPTKTILAIEEALVKDQGATFRGILGKEIPLVGDAYSTNEEPFRSHLGASLIGRKCSRELWYAFHWTTRPNFEGRILRLFNRGHLEEARMISILKMIGCQVWSTDQYGKQFRIKGHRHHYGGALDSVVMGIPDLPGIAILAEYKTHSWKSFTKIEEEGCLKAKWEHFIQQQQYMGAYNLPYSLYMAVNKDTDALYLELIQYDPVQDSRYKQRAAMIIDSPAPPPKISEKASWFDCKFCDHHAVCHQKKLPDKNCRTCQYSEPVDDGKWQCSYHCIDLPKELQFAGCTNYAVSQNFVAK
jgi:hypothetical protein